MTQNSKQDFINCRPTSKYLSTSNTQFSNGKQLFNWSH